MRTSHTQRLAQIFVRGAFAGLLVAGIAPMAFAATLTIETDGSWLAKNVAPGPGWEVIPGFDTAADGGWISASVNIADCFGTADCIWYDGQFSATQDAYLRTIFTISGPILSGILLGGVDDDADIWVNGVLAYSDHDGASQAFGPINIAPFLVQGLNLIAVQAWDDFPLFGKNHDFVATVSIDTPSVPEPTTLWLLVPALAGLAWLNRGRSK
jgi:hypothetical protein